MKLTTTKNAGKLLAILITMQMLWYNAESIARWSTSRALLEATGCRHPANACTALPRQPPSHRFPLQTQITNKTQLLASNSTLAQAKSPMNFGTQKGPSAHVIDATSCVKM